MIEVKGTRTSHQPVDATDPLGLRKPAVEGGGLITGFVAGLIGVAVYLRSFLWYEMPMAEAAPAPVPAQGGAAPAVSVSRLGPAAAPAEDQNSATMTLPVVFGPFETGVFAPLRQISNVFVPTNEPANSVLPAFPSNPPSVQAGGGAPLSVVFGDDNPVVSGGPDYPDLTEAPPPNPAAAAVPRNRAPQNTGPVHLGEVGSGTAMAIAMSGLLANSADADGNPLFVVQPSAPVGTLQPRSGGLLYIADPEELGTVQISYRVTDGLQAVSQTATVTVVENVFEGTRDADLILGTEGRDRIFGHGGDDDLAAFGGRDVVFAGFGDDNISGGAGRDTIYGEEGNDLIAAGADADWVYGGDGDDRLFGEAGDDHLQGDAGNDLIDGGLGMDTLLGGDGDDTLSAGDGADLAAGGTGDDELFGDMGNDVLFGDEGEDRLAGGVGEDVLFGGQSDDHLDGGADNDVLSGEAGNDTVLGDDGADLASGGDGHDVIDGGRGNDVLLGEAGNDQLVGGMGEDTLVGGTGDDRFSGDSDGADDVIDGGEGVDLLSYATMSEDLTIDLILEIATSAEIGEDAFSGIEAFVGGSGDDIFIAETGSATLTGNCGADVFTFVQGDTVDRQQGNFRVTDFGMDDRLSFYGQSSGVEIRRAQSALEDRIDDLFEDFADRLNADQPKIRYFHEWAEEYRRTVVEVDFDRDNTVDLTLALDGEFMLEVWR